MDKPKPEVPTLFKDVMNPDFVIRLKESEKGDFPSPPIREDYFFMIKSSKSETLTKFYLQLVDGRIYMRNSSEGALLAYLDIEYSSMRVVKDVEKEGCSLNGIRFVKNKSYEEILHAKLPIIQDWFEILKKYCILCKFREFFTFKALLGRGSFASVYVTTRNSDGKDFAVKVFEKKSIEKNQFERVACIYLGLLPSGN